MLAPVLHILPLTTIRRERLLPTPGRIVVRMDQKVSPLDVIAEANLGYEHVLLDVARELGLPVEKANALIRCKVGERVDSNQVIAESRGMVPHSVRAPRPGRVVAVGSGQVLLEVGEAAYELRAGIPGTVTRLIPERGAEIQTTGALIQGVWGNSRVDVGLLLPLIETPEDALTARRLDVSLRGSVILAGHCSDADALRAAGDLPVRGLILSSISPALLSLAMQMRYPIVVTDGFGRLPMNSAAFKLLTTNAKREVTVNGEPYDRNAGMRPEVIIPLPVSRVPPLPRDLETFAPDQQVRLCRAPHAGEIATLISLPPGLAVLPSGLRAHVGQVRLEDGEQIIVPLANMEVLG